MKVNMNKYKYKHARAKKMKKNKLRRGGKKQTWKCSIKIKIESYGTSSKCEFIAAFNLNMVLDASNSFPIL